MTIIMGLFIGAMIVLIAGVLMRLALRDYRINKGFDDLYKQYEKSEKADQVKEKYVNPFTDVKAKDYVKKPENQHVTTPKKPFVFDENKRVKKSNK